MNKCDATNPCLRLMAGEDLEWPAWWEPPDITGQDGEDGRAGATARRGDAAGHHARAVMSLDFISGPATSESPPQSLSSARWRPVPPVATVRSPQSILSRTELLRP